MAELTAGVQFGPRGGPPVDVAGFEGLYARYSFERDEAERLAVSGEGESSLEQVEERHRGLCTPEALASLREAAAQASVASERRRADLLGIACAAGIANRELAGAADELINRLAAATLEHDGATLGLFQALGQLPAIDDFEERERLAREAEDCKAAFEPLKAQWHRRYDAVWTEVTGEPDPVERAEQRCGVDFADLEDALVRVLEQSEPAYRAGYRTLLPRLLGHAFSVPPAPAQMGYATSLRALAGAQQPNNLLAGVEATLAGAGLSLAGSGVSCDLEARPGKNPRPCAVAVDPPRSVYLIALPSGGLNDYLALLHECGHALGFAGIDPQLPFALRRLSNDWSLSEAYASLFEQISHDPTWHEQHFGVAPEQAAERAGALSFIDMLMFRRYAAKLRYETLLLRGLDDLEARGRDYARLLGEATGLAYRPQLALFDVDDGFYCADYLRSWITAAQLREWLEAECGPPWWRSRRAAELLAPLFAQGNSLPVAELSRQLGFDPLDVEPLLRQQQRALGQVASPAANVLP